MREARLYTEERAKFVEKMGEAPLLYWRFGIVGLDGCGAGKIGR